MAADRIQSDLRRHTQAGRCQQTRVGGSVGAFGGGCVERRTARLDEASAELADDQRDVTHRWRRQRTPTRAVPADHGPQHPMVAPSAGRHVSVAQRRSVVTSAAATSAGRNVSGSQRQRAANVSGPQRQRSQRQRGATSTSRNVRVVTPAAATSAGRNVSEAQRQSAVTCLRRRRRRTRLFSLNDGTRQTVQNTYKYLCLGVPLFRVSLYFWNSVTTGLLALRVTLD